MAKTKKPLKEHTKDYGYPKPPKVEFKLLVAADNFALVIVNDVTYYVNQEGYTAII